MGKHVTAPRPRGIRRFLRFSLRSLMLLTLAVAAWLGYEVQQARTVQRQAEAIRALGGEVEFETSPWSLLRFIEPQTYGRRVEAVELPSERVDAATPLLKAMSGLREIRVMYNADLDERPNWEMLRAQFRDKLIVPVAAINLGA